MGFADNSLKDWEDILNKFRYLFRNEKTLLSSGRLTDRNFLKNSSLQCSTQSRSIQKRNESKLGRPALLHGCGVGLPFLLKGLRNLF